MKFVLGSGFAVLAVAAMTAPVVAQSTVQELRTANTITLSGEIVRVMGDNFVLDDGTGQIMVDAESSAVRDAQLSPGDSATVTGRYDDEDFDAVTITPASGEVIYVLSD